MVFEILSGAGIVIAFLAGIRLMQSPHTALWGNRLGALAMLAAIALAIREFGIDGSGIVFVLAGGAAGAILGQKVHMIQMPQMVALFNGLGGAASALVAATAMAAPSDEVIPVFWLTAALALGIGTLTFGGSIIAALKLHARISQKPVIFPAQSAVLGFLLFSGAVFTGLLVFEQTAVYPLLLILVFAAYGVLMALRVGGADMPVIISFLNSLSGIAASVSGLAVGDPVLAGVGALVGVAGMILTQVMCRSMNRSLAAVLGGFRVGEPREEEDRHSESAPSAGAGASAASAGSAAVEAPQGAGTPHGAVAPAAAAGSAAAGSSESPKRRLTEENLYPLLHEAERVIIVPGYGMALAKAQRAVKTLANLLARDGKRVSFAIHPVAGRMPGHMNVLLAEAGIGFNRLHDMRVINPEFQKADVAIIVGACDVVNPAASTAKGTPIYGMPVLSVSQARAVVICNLDDKPGYSGVENTLYSQEHVIPLWGDAAATLERITAGYRGARAELPADTGAAVEMSETALEIRERIRASGAPSALTAASHVAVVPGYGMARAYAGEAVKVLIDSLKASGKRVVVGIHPYAGRIPGHIPFLLDQAGVEDRLFGFPKDMNADFASFDLVIGVGANDIINPSLAVKAAEEPFVVPPFDAWRAKQIILCNVSADTGWAGVPNPLFSRNNVITLSGDAQEALSVLTDEYAAIPTAQ